MSDNFLHNSFEHLFKQFPASWVITLTAHKLEVGILASVCQQLAELAPAVRILHQHTLVNELDWRANAQLSQAEQLSPVITLQWLVDGDEGSDFGSRLKQQFANVSLPIDIHAMPLATLLRPHKLALFDMDSTLIEQEVIVELAKKAGIGEQVNAITEAAMRGEIDFVESFRRRVGLLTGLPEQALHEIVRDNISFSLGAKRLIRTLKANGYHVVLVSGGFDFFAKFVQAELGIDEIFANPLDIVDGQVTGKVTAPIVDGKRKAEILQAVAQRLNIELSETVAVGDGANDLPMLALADIGIAYRAKPVVREQADYAVSVAGLDGVLAILGLSAVDLA